MRISPLKQRKVRKIHSPVIRVYGFTLLELLIALFIFTILAMLSTSALHTVIKAGAGTENNAERLRNLQTALLLISREIEQTIDRPITNSIGKEEVAFLGTPRGFTFTHLGLENPLSSIAKSALERSGYFWQKEKLWRLVWPSLDQPPKAKAHTRVILNGVSYAHFEYLDGEGRFHEQWPLEAETNRVLPRAVKIDLTLANWGKLSQTYVIVADAFKNPNAQTPEASDRDAGKEKKVEREDDDEQDDDDSNVEQHINHHAPPPAKEDKADDDE